MTKMSECYFKLELINNAISWPNRWFGILYCVSKQPGYARLIAVVKVEVLCGT